MDIEKVRRLLSDVALDHSAKKPEDAIQKIALALMHIAEAVNKLENDVSGLRK